MSYGSSSASCATGFVSKGSTHLAGWVVSMLDVPFQGHLLQLWLRALIVGEAFKLFNVVILNSCLLEEGDYLLDQLCKGVRCLVLAVGYGLRTTIACMGWS